MKTSYGRITLFAFLLLAGALLILAGLVVQAEPRAGGVSVYSLVCFLLAAGLSVAAFLKPRGRG